MTTNENNEAAKGDGVGVSLNVQIKKFTNLLFENAYIDALQYQVGRTSNLTKSQTNTHTLRK